MRGRRPAGSPTRPKKPCTPPYRRALATGFLKLGVCERLAIEFLRIEGKGLIRPASQGYLALVLLVRDERSKELEILVLRHELSILRQQVRRPQFLPGDRLLLAALSRVLPRRSWRAFVVRPETRLRWHR